MNFLRATILLGLLLFTSVLAFGQRTISGKVTDTETGEGIPFANVYFKGSTVGATTDFEGFYRIEYSGSFDSLIASYVGYESRVKALSAASKQSVDFQLDPVSLNLQEVVILPGENPAWRIMRQVIQNKDENDKRNLEAYQYESYNKIEIDVDNISDKMRERKVFRQLGEVYDSMKVVAGEDGRPIMPLFISESISELYFKSNPDRKRENIVKTRFKGVGIEDGSLVSQLIGSTFQEYNFYENWMNILSKEFVSPIANSWKLYYEYLLTDSLYIGDDFCYKMEVNPKQEQELAFYGTIWITQKDYALKQVDLTITSNANLNYIEKIKIQQELEKTDAGPWLPKKNRVLMRAANIDKNLPGLLAKFYTSNKEIVVNKPQNDRFYEDIIVLEEDYLLEDEVYWSDHRHDSLTQTELYLYDMIDTINSLPIIKSYVEIVDIFVNGYKDIGSLEFGPYIYTYAFNDIEGHRFRAGLKTNYKFSSKWTLSGYGAYGTKDEKWKYRGQVNYLFSRRNWTEISVYGQYDLKQVAVNEYDPALGNLFLASTKWFEQFRPYYSQEFGVEFNTEIRRGVTGLFRFRNFSFVPDETYAFAYNEETENGVVKREDFINSEVTFGLRFTRGERWLQNDNSRISLGTKIWPIFTLTFSRGIMDLMGGDFNYDKVNLGITHKLPLGGIGYSRYFLDVGKIFQPLPYPLLNVHLGNSNSIFYTAGAYNLMGRSEFVSDEYVTLRYTHHFDGNLFHRIPLIRELKWRALFSFNSVFGTVSQENIDLIPETDLDDEPVDPIKGLERGIPYLEIGYGIENIFKVLRVDAFHRLNYLDQPFVQRFALKFSVQIIL